MRCGWSYRPRRDSLTHFFTSFFQTELGRRLQFPVPYEKNSYRNESSPHGSSDDSTHTASPALKLGSEHYQSSGACLLEGLTLRRRVL